MPTEDEMRAYYEKQKEYDIRTKGKSELSPTFEEFMGRKGHQAAKKPKPAPAPSPAPQPPKRAVQPTLGSRIKSAGMEWLENAGANVRGQAPVHKPKGRAGNWLANAGANIRQMDMSVNPFGSIGLPQGPAQLPPGWGFGQGPPLRREPPPHRESHRGKKKKKHRREPEEEVAPWNPGYIPPGARRFF